MTKEELSLLQRVWEFRRWYGTYPRCGLVFADRDDEEVLNLRRDGYLERGGARLVLTAKGQLFCKERDENA